MYAIVNTERIQVSHFRFLAEGRQETYVMVKVCVWVYVDVVCKHDISRKEMCLNFKRSV